MKNLCLYEIGRGGGGSPGSGSSFSQYKIASAESLSSPLRPHVNVLCMKCECMAVSECDSSAATSPEPSGSISPPGAREGDGGAGG